MRDSFFKTQREQGCDNSLAKDIFRLIRDILSIANDFVHLRVLELIIDSLNQIIDDKSSPSMGL